MNRFRLNGWGRAIISFFLFLYILSSLMHSFLQNAGDFTASDAPPAELIAQWTGVVKQAPKLCGRHGPNSSIDTIPAATPAPPTPSATSQNDVMQAAFIALAAQSVTKRRVDSYYTVMTHVSKQ